MIPDFCLGGSSGGKGLELRSVALREDLADPHPRHRGPQQKPSPVVCPGKPGRISGEVASPCPLGGYQQDGGLVLQGCVLRSIEGIVPGPPRSKFEYLEVTEGTPTADRGTPTEIGPVPIISEVPKQG